MRRDIRVEQWMARGAEIERDRIVRHAIEQLDNARISVRDVMVPRIEASDRSIRRCAFSLFGPAATDHRKGSDPCRRSCRLLAAGR